MMNSTFHNTGFQIVSQCIDSATITTLGALPIWTAGRRAGTRLGLTNKTVAAVGNEIRQQLLNHSFITDYFDIISCIAFTKNPTANWTVPFHRDEFFALAHRVDSPHYSEWCHKEGLHFAKPCQAITQRIIAVRLAIDNNDSDNGPLRIIPASHLGDGDFTDQTPVDIHLKAGDALLFSPRCLHSSGKIHHAANRRVLHFAFGPADLPDGARWQVTG